MNRFRSLEVSKPADGTDGGSEKEDDAEGVEIQKRLPPLMILRAVIRRKISNWMVIMRLLIHRKHVSDVVDTSHCLLIQL